MKQKIDPKKKFFNTQEAIEKYGKAVFSVGLWKSEKIILEKYASKSSYILDIGCGAGRTTFSIYDLGYYNVVGIDIADVLVQFARNYSKEYKYNIRFENMDASHMSFNNEKFDVAFFSYNGLTGIPTEERRLTVLNEVYRILKPGGYFIFTAHDRDEELTSKSFWVHEKERWNSGNNNPELYEYGDVLVTQGNVKEFLHYYSKGEMLEFIDKTKFKIVESLRRSDIADEEQKVKDFSKETCFWILKK